jgi:hypothetical protein
VSESIREAPSKTPAGSVPESLTRPTYGRKRTGGGVVRLSDYWMGFGADCGADREVAVPSRLPYGINGVGTQRSSDLPLPRRSTVQSRSRARMTGSSFFQSAFRQARAPSRVVASNWAQNWT